LIGTAAGMAVGTYKFGDRQRVHNLYVAERLRKRYPESKYLEVHDLWQYKGVQATHEYYRWK